MPTASNLKFEEGQWWYIQPSDNTRRSLDAHNRKNYNRMFVSGKYIPKSHPMHKPGNYSSFEEAWSHRDLDRAKPGYVYAVTNPAWPGWVKVGMAVDSQDRLNSYQTGSPLRDYELLCDFKSEDKTADERKAHMLLRAVASEFRGEWFKVDTSVAYTLVTDLEKLPNPLQSPEQEPCS